MLSWSNNSRNENDAWKNICLHKITVNIFQGNLNYRNLARFTCRNRNSLAGIRNPLVENPESTTEDPESTTCNAESSNNPPAGIRNSLLRIDPESTSRNPESTRRNIEGYSLVSIIRRAKNLSCVYNLPCNSPISKNLTKLVSW